MEAEAEAESETHPGDGGTRMVQLNGLPLWEPAVTIQTVCAVCIQLPAHFHSFRAGSGPSRFRTSLLCLLCACQTLEAQASPNRRRNKSQRAYGWSHDPEVNQYATNLTDLAWPVLQNLGFSGLVGIVCAVAFKVGIVDLKPHT